MRFVLVGVSLALAWIAAWRCMTSEEGGQAQQQQQQRAAAAGEKGSGCGDGRWRRGAATLLDMFTGRYIYNYCRATAPQPAAAKAAAAH